MKLYYYQDPVGNFGDDLNPWLWSRLVPELLDDDAETLFVGIGSILNEKMPKSPFKVVFGAGVGYGRAPTIDQSWKIYCVRGPLSTAALELPDDLAITDPAVLVRTLRKPTRAQDSAVSFIPHHETCIRGSVDVIDFQAVCDTAGVTYIDPSEGVESVLNRLQSSHLVIAEAMHGAIVADALRIPWIPVQIYNHVVEFKWWDWCKSLGLEYMPVVYSYDSQGDRNSSLASFIHSVARKGCPTLSRDAAIDAATSRLEEQLQQLRLDREVVSDVAPYYRSIPDPGQPTPASHTEEMDSLLNRQISRQASWKYQFYRLMHDIAGLIPAEKPFILVDDGMLATAISPGYSTIPFLERDGEYWGPPPDDGTAIQELERLRQSGADYMVFAWPAFWWLDYYSGLHDYVRATFRCILQNERLVVFDLRARRSN